MSVKFFYIIFFLVLSVLLELFLQGFGLSFPFTAFFIFYIATSFGWKEALFAAVFASCGLDLAVGHLYFCSMAGFVLTIFLSRFWLYKVRSDSIILHFIPGGIIPLFQWGGNMFFHPARLASFGDRLLLLPGNIAAGMIYLPLLILLLDTLHEAMGMELYANKKLFLDKEGER